MKNKRTITKPWFYDRSKFIRSEEDRVWREERANAADDVWPPTAAAAAPPAAPEPVVAMPSRVLPEPPLAEPPILLESPSSGSTASGSPENFATPPFRPWWKRLLWVK